jgi:hypothetical protein
MPAILRGETSTERLPAAESPETEAGARTLLAVAVAASLLLAVILGLWSVEPPRADCAVGSAACDTHAPLVPARSR